MEPLSPISADHSSRISGGRPSRAAAIASGLLLVAIVIDKLALASRHQRGAINSDSLYTYAWLRDALGEREGFFWYGPPNPFFFPDALLYLPSMALTEDVGLQLLLYSVFYLLLLVGALAGVAYALVKRWDEALLFGAIGVASLSLFPDLLPMYRQKVPMPNEHGGALLTGVAFIGLAAVMWLDQTSTRSARVLLIGTLALATASNLIFPVQFVAPLCAAAILMALLGQIDRRRLMSLLVDVAVATALAYAIRWAVQASGVFTFARAPWNGSLENIVKSIRVLEAEWLPVMNEQLGPIGIALVIAWLLVSVVVLGAAAKRARAGANSAASLELADRRVVFVVLGANLAMLASIAAPVLTAVWAHGVSPRYVWPFPLLGFLLLAPVCIALLPRRSAVVGRAVAVVGALLAIGIVVRAWPQIEPARLRFEPDEAGRKLLALKREGQIGDGLGEYWSARLLTVMTGHKLLVNPVTGELGPELWLANSARFFARTDGSRPVYDFIVTNNLDKQKIAKAFGEPLRIERAGEHEIWLYGRPIAADMPERACRFALEIGARCSMLETGVELLGMMNVGDAGVRNEGSVRPAPDRTGTMVFGPYVKLPAGRYEVTWQFDRAAEAMPSRFLVFSRWGQNIVHDVRDSPARHDGLVRLEFDVPRDRRADLWEFPVVNEQRVGTPLTSVRLRKLN